MLAHGLSGGLHMAGECRFKRKLRISSGTKSEALGNSFKELENASEQPWPAGPRSCPGLRIK